ncbi:TrmH family RNA methyltransferase [Demequina sediminicola]|uniref:TrmH family RNA methyltransferase n=1 Tax=Demequina sediminicola TaxID=1095026 RepID=UPI000782A737|nr:RNA methyltransferase [Demequina sediminicola]
MTERPAARADLVLTLTNVKAERIKKVAALAGRSARSRAGAVLVEGPQAVREAVTYAAERVRDLYLTEQALERYPEIADRALEAERFVHVGTPEVLAAMSKDARGVVAVLDDAGTSLDVVIDAKPTLVAVLSNVRDPGNAGTVIRAADAAGADAIVLVGECVDISNPKVIRATAGSIFHLPVVRSLPFEDALAELSGAGLRLLAADGSGEVTLGGDSADASALSVPTAWVFGNEAWGFSDDELALVDDVVRIPIYGRAESLNLSTAASVCLYASAQAQQS